MAKKTCDKEAFSSAKQYTKPAKTQPRVLASHISSNVLFSRTLTQQQGTWLGATLMAQRETSGRPELQAPSFAGRSETITKSCLQRVSCKRNPPKNRKTNRHKPTGSFSVGRQQKQSSLEMHSAFLTASKAAQFPRLLVPTVPFTPGDF